MPPLKRPLLALAVASLPMAASALTLDLVDPKGAVSLFEWSVNGNTIELRTDWQQQAAAFIQVSDLTSRTNFVVRHRMTNLSNHAFARVALELLDPVRPGSDAAYDAAYDLSPQPWFVPAGYSTSNPTDGLSFAKPGGPFLAVARSSTAFTGVAFDESASSQRDHLDFHGGQIAAHGGVDSLMTFGLRDNSRAGDDQYNQTFLLSMRPNVSTVGVVPEPPAWALVLAGLSGVIGVRRRIARA